MFQRPIFQQLLDRLTEPRRFMQVLAGPRQVGKTTLARQVIAQLTQPSHYASADAPSPQGPVWLEQQWEVARLQAREDPGGGLLVLDEVQKVSGWSEVVKRMWDQDSAAGLALRVMLLGSAPLLVQKGIGESLAGRFEQLPVTHWSYAEMCDAFGFSLDEYVYFGGYPGAASLRADGPRWNRYILDSLVETTLSRDILWMTQVNKPALLRQLFHLACAYSGQILSYQKMLGQLQEAGNTTTLAHYLHLLAGAGMVTGLSKYAGEQVRRRASSPKLQVMNMALMSALSGLSFQAVRENPEHWGRWVESAVGAHLLHASLEHQFELFYWRDRNREVDFVVRHHGRLIAIEVKSTRRPVALPGMEAFAKAFNPERVMLVGGDGISVEAFLTMDPQQWLAA